MANFNFKYRLISFYKIYNKNNCNLTQKYKAIRVIISKFGYIEKFGLVIVLEIDIVILLEINKYLKIYFYNMIFLLDLIINFGVKSNKKPVFNI